MAADGDREGTAAAAALDLERRRFPRDSALSALAGVARRAKLPVHEAVSFLTYREWL